MINDNGQLGSSSATKQLLLIAESLHDSEHLCSYLKCSCARVIEILLTIILGLCAIEGEQYRGDSLCCDRVIILIRKRHLRTVVHLHVGVRRTGRRKMYFARFDLLASYQPVWSNRVKLI